MAIALAVLLVNNVVLTRLIAMPFMKSRRLMPIVGPGSCPVAVAVVFVSSSEAMMITLLALEPFTCENDLNISLAAKAECGECRLGGDFVFSRRLEVSTRKCRLCGAGCSMILL